MKSYEELSNSERIEFLRKIFEKIGCKKQADTVLSFPGVIDVFEMRHLIGQESDRGCALIAADFLDSELKRLFEGYLVKNNTVFEALFKPDGPIYSFSAKINLAFSLGLISHKVYLDLHRIRKIRNEFAHSHKDIHFEDEVISGYCEKFVYEFFGEGLSPRDKFTRVATGINASIHAAMLTNTQLSPLHELEVSEEHRTLFNKLIEVAEKEIKG